MFKDLVFISLPSPFAKEPAMNPPLGIAYLVSYLRPFVDSIRVVDFATFDYDYKSKEYLKEIPKDADLYGISCMSPQFYWLKEIALYLKQNTNAKIVAGGPHPTSMVSECLKFVDYVVIGEGELPMQALVMGVPLSEIEGIGYKDKKRIITTPRVFVKDLNSLPFPDRGIFDLSKYKRNIDGEPAIHLVTLRGCSYACSFCDKNMVGRKVRFRSISNVIEEIDLYREKGYNSFVIYDDIFTLIPKRIAEFCEAAKERGIKWRCWSRTDLIDKSKLTKMKDAGLTSITYGVESGDDGILRNVNKKTTVADNRVALLAAKEIGVPVRCSLMYGCPGETMSSLKNTIKLIKETQPDEWNLAVFRPIPGSAIWNNPSSFGISFDKKALAAQSYMPTNRFGETGVGDLCITLDSMTNIEYSQNLKYFVSELERVCPRKQIQDTIQTIKM